MGTLDQQRRPLPEINVMNNCIWRMNDEGAYDISCCREGPVFGEYGESEEKPANFKWCPFCGLEIKEEQEKAAAGG